MTPHKPISHNVDTLTTPSGSVRSIVSNAVSLLASDVVQRAATFCLYALVARHLGTFAFGQLSLALSLFYTFQVIATAGLKTLVTREIARDRVHTVPYLLNGTMVVAGFSVASTVALVAFSWSMNYASQTVTIILLVSLGLLPYALSELYDGVFQAWEQMHYIAYANAPVNVAKVGLVFLMLQMGYDLIGLTLLLLALHLMVVGIKYGLMRRYIITPSTRRFPAARPDCRFCLSMIKSTGTFLGIDSLIAILASVNVVLLSKLADETAVGLYSAAIQLTVPILLLYQSVVLSIFPTLCKRFDTDASSVTGLAEAVIALLVAIALPTAVGLTLLADESLLFLYGQADFLVASPALCLLAWCLLPGALTQALGRVLFAGRHEKITLRILVVNLLLNLVVGFFLIQHLGLLGAALTMLVIRLVNMVQHYLPVSRLLTTMGLRKLLWKPALASLLMAAYLALVTLPHVLLTIASAAMVYTAILLVLTFRESNTWRPLTIRSLMDGLRCTPSTAIG